MRKEWIYLHHLKYKGKNTYLNSRVLHFCDDKVDNIEHFYHHHNDRDDNDGLEIQGAGCIDLKIRWKK